MNRREFIAGLGSVAAWPVVARAQQPAMPVIGYLESGSAGSILEKAFRNGLSEIGYIEGQNVMIEYRFADGNFGRLSELAADLVRRRVAVIATPGSTPASLAAKAASTTIPIVFGVATDPVQTGLVSRFNRPGGNVTGFSEMNTEVGPKRFEFLHKLVAQDGHFGVLVNPTNPFTREIAVREAQAAAATIGRPIQVLAASTDHDIETVFASLIEMRIKGLVVTPDPTFSVNLHQLIALAARYAVPAIYWDGRFPEAAGLMSYGTRAKEGYRQVGIYVGRILRGEKPADLPVLQPTKFELVINLKTAKALGLTIPETLLATADEVIQ